MEAALFDCDGTLYSAQMGWGMLKYVSENGPHTMARLYRASLLPHYALSKLRVIRRQSFIRQAVGRQGWLIRGWSLEQANEAFRWIVDKFLLPTAHEEVVGRLQEHRERGHAVVLVSGMMMPCLQLLGEHFQATGVVGTAAETANGRYTGRLGPPIMTGGPKTDGTRAFFESRGWEVDWENSFAYADSIDDRSLFDLVGHPVAVHPDPDLATYAREQRWEIIG